MAPDPYQRIGGTRAHRIIAAQAIGRPLLPGEVVHHIDGDPRNNDPANLQVLESQAEHVRLHSRHIGCSISGCERKHAGHGLCATHLKQVRDRERGVKPRKAADRPCCIEGCERQVHARDLCQTHSRRAARAAVAA